MRYLGNYHCGAVRFATADRILQLPHLVLRPGSPIAEIIFEEDSGPGYPTLRIV